MSDLSGESCREYLAQTTAHMGLITCIDDSYICMQANKKTYVSSYWNYVILYANDVLAFYHHPKGITNILAKGLEIPKMAPP